MTTTTTGPRIDRLAPLLIDPYIAATKELGTRDLVVIANVQADGEIELTIDKRENVLERESQRQGASVQMMAFCATIAAPPGQGSDLPFAFWLLAIFPDGGVGCCQIHCGPKGERVS